MGEPETCPAERAARVRREALAGAWSKLEFREDDGGRHFLDGEPIHCSNKLELQAIEDRYDDYGEYHALLQRGVRVRYELAWGDGALDKRVVLHASVDGHEFTTRLQDWMRFRWSVVQR